MKFLNQLTKKFPAQTSQPTQHEEPQGHMHSNFRHWIWFTPSDQRAQ